MTFNTYMVNNWKHLCQKFNVPEGVALKNLIGKENEATVVQEVTEGSINRNTDRDRGLLEDVEEEDDNLWSIHHFLMTWKDIPYSVMVSRDIVQELTEESLVKQSSEKIMDCLKWMC